MHPYQTIDASQRWSSSMARAQTDRIDPVHKFDFCITERDRVATAGSCFAQHIARYLRNEGFSYCQVETPHPMVKDADVLASYQMFSARYGNIYTTSQLVQLVERAYGNFEPSEDFWQSKDAWHDPFRPSIEPGGFSSRREAIIDRTRHLAAVRQMFDEIDYFIFTLGLTELWKCRDDGAVLPIAPGVIAGEFQDSSYVFENLGYEDVLRDLRRFIEMILVVNPRMRFIFTVSPVPLAATYEPRHVLQSTVASKSILRAACDTVSREYKGVAAYFPSFEIITGPHARGRYFGDDLRSVTEDGVRSVMSLFFQHATTRQLTELAPDQLQDLEPSNSNEREDEFERGRELAQALCDEELLDSDADSA